jgi:carbamoyl-phosphate synthase small subunit
MNAVICTVDELELKCLQWRGWELASKVSTRNLITYGDENATYKISALDLGIKTNTSQPC